MEYLQRLFKGDKIIWILFFTLCIVSLLSVFSASSMLAYNNSRPFAPIVKHAFILLTSVIWVVVLHNFHYKRTGKFTLFLLSFSVILLIVTLVTGQEKADASRWLNLFGFSFQPSELAKLSLVMFTAWELGAGQRSPEMMRRAFWSVLIVTGLLLGLIITQNLSTALLMGVFVWLMMIIANVPWRYLWRLTLAVLLVGGLILFLLIQIPSVGGVDRWATWHNRVTREKIDVKDPRYTITDDNLQVHYAKIAISQGKGVGVLPGNSSQRDFLPQAFSDFIYAVIIEESGWLGMIGIPMIYIFLLFRCQKIANKCRKPVPMLLVMGSALIITLQASINMAVSVGLFPVTGQPMPMISKGGTSQWITSLYFAIILSVSRFGEEEEERAVLEAEAAEDERRRAEAARLAAERLADEQSMEQQDYADMAG